ncbi:hypothetical protein TNIN_259671 [Trichonephila inaurata madagascariensis]|uniref:Uncharacterized protein n=1 Tax=Trichonephila inaurata madagascariensis TaxID=2747483 RepID=A0A8X6WVH9_9ARAC|nr:hypothetical protein TNIN_259671 [Trichonephila inaurata madagascariensis]
MWAAVIVWSQSRASMIFLLREPFEAQRLWYISQEASQEKQPNPWPKNYSEIPQVRPTPKGLPKKAPLCKGFLLYRAMIRDSESILGRE